MRASTPVPSCRMILTSLSVALLLCRTGGPFFRNVDGKQCVIRVTIGNPDDEPMFAPGDKKRNEEVGGICRVGVRVGRLSCRSPVVVVS